MITRSRTRKRVAEPVYAARSPDEDPCVKRQRRQRVESVTMDQVGTNVVRGTYDRVLTNNFQQLKMCVYIADASSHSGPDC